MRPYRHWTDHKWHEIKLSLDHISTLSEKYDYCNEILSWIIENIEGYQRHSRWDMTFEGIRVKFRYERDYLIFTLRWS